MLSEKSQTQRLCPIWFDIHDIWEKCKIGTENTSVTSRGWGSIDYKGTKEFGGKWNSSLYWLHTVRVCQRVRFYTTPFDGDLGTEMCFLTILESRSPRSRCWRVWFLLSSLSLACRWPPSPRSHKNTPRCCLRPKLSLEKHQSCRIEAQSNNHVLPELSL